MDALNNAPAAALEPKIAHLQISPAIDESAVELRHGREPKEGGVEEIH